MEPIKLPKCLVCFKTLGANSWEEDKTRRGLYGECDFCSQTCAVFYARSAVMLATGHAYIERQIEAELTRYKWVTDRRAKRTK